MKNKTIQNANVSLNIFPLILGSLTTIVLFLLRYFQILHLDLEIVLAPFVVTTLLTYGDRLPMILFLFPINFISMAIGKWNAKSKDMH